MSRCKLFLLITNRKAYTMARLRLNTEYRNKIGVRIEKSLTQNDTAENYTRPDLVIG